MAWQDQLSRACAYLLDNALTPGGHFTASGAPSGTVDCLPGSLCEALVELGYGDDPRLATALAIAMRLLKAGCE